MVSPLTLTQTLLEPSSADASYYFPWCVTASGGRAGTDEIKAFLGSDASLSSMIAERKMKRRKEGFSFSVFHQQMKTKFGKLK